MPCETISHDTLHCEQTENLIPPDDGYPSQQVLACCGARVNPLDQGVLPRAIGKLVAWRPGKVVEVWILTSDIDTIKQLRQAVSRMIENWIGEQEVLAELSLNGLQEPNSKKGSKGRSQERLAASYCG